MAPRGILHFPLNRLLLRRGGLIKAVMLRANALAAADREVVIEVLAFQPFLEEEVAELVADGFLDPRVHVRSILRCLDPSMPQASATDPIAGCVHHGIPLGRPPAPAGSLVDRRRDPRAVVFGPAGVGRLVPYRLGVRVPQEEDGRVVALRSVDRWGRVVRRDELGSGGRVVRVVEYRPGDPRPVTQRWIGRDGRCFLTVWWAPGSRDWSVSFAAVGDEVQPLPDPQALYRLAFEQALRHEVDPVLFSEFREGLSNVPGRGFDDVVLDVRHPSLRRAAVIHSNHALAGRSAPPLRSSPNFTALLEGIAKWDLVVTATEQQRADIAEQYGGAERITAIPHYAPDPPAELDTGYDPNRFVLVARIHRKKRVDEAIEAFQLVVDAIPTARLHVYGFGYGDELETRIADLVQRRGLGEHVQFHGFVNDVSEIYRGSCATLQTSQSEGFGMALLESLAHGVPVVAYDVAYGPRDAIRDGVDGFIVPWGDRAALANRLVRLATDAQLRARLAAAAPAGAARFSRERYVREWGRALEALPVRVAADAGVRVDIVEGGLARFAFAPAGTVVLRPRDHGAELRGEWRDGAATVQLPAAPEGSIYDVFVRALGAAPGEELRATLAEAHGDDSTWRAYNTRHGSLSLKRVAPEVGQGTVADVRRFARRAARGVLRRLRAGSAARLIGRRAG